MLLSSPMSHTPFRPSTATPACDRFFCGGRRKHSSEGSSVSLLSSHGRAVCDQAALLAIRQNWLWLDGIVSDQSELFTIRHNWSWLDRTGPDQAEMPMISLNWSWSGIKCSWSTGTPSDCGSQTAIPKWSQCSSVSHCSAAAHRLFCHGFTTPTKHVSVISRVESENASIQTGNAATGRAMVHKDLNKTSFKQFCKLNINLFFLSFLVIWYSGSGSNLASFANRHQLPISKHSKMSLSQINSSFKWLSAFTDFIALTKDTALGKSWP